MQVPANLLSYLERSAKFEMLREGRQEDEIVARCPFPANHAGGDEHPSWGINTRTGLWHCFSCHEGGSFTVLVERLGLPVLMEMGEARDDDEVRRRIQDIRERVSGAADERSSTYYPLPDTYTPFPPGEIASESAKYLLGRIGMRWETAARNGVGYCSLTGAIIYPIPDEDGRQVAWQKRNLPGSDWIPHVFPEGFKKSLFVYGLHLADRDEPLIVVESIKSALLLGQRGLRAAAILGSSLSDHQARLLGRVREIILLLDGDAAGREGQRDARRTLIAHYPGTAWTAELPLRGPKDKRTSPDDYPFDVVTGVLRARRTISLFDGPSIAEIRGKLESGIPKKLDASGGR